MKKKIVTMAILAVAFTAAVVSCTGISGTDNKATAASGTKDSAAIRVARGEYLVTIAGCDDCHSPKKMGAHGPEVIPELRLSGFQQNSKLPPVAKQTVQGGWALMAMDMNAAVGPWGISYAANISSDSTGIGSWKEENFIRAMREGKSKGLEQGRPLLPPMPWPGYRNMTDEDLKSIFAYLKTTKPVHNVVPQPVALADIK